jgi:hypothetical protein
MRDTIELAREAQMPYFWQSGEIAHLEQLKRFEALVRADERNTVAALVEQMGIEGYGTLAIAAAIRARGETK